MEIVPGALAVTYKVSSRFSASIAPNVIRSPLRVAVGEVPLKSRASIFALSTFDQAVESNDVPSLAIEQPTINDSPNIVTFLKYRNLRMTCLGEGL